MNTQKPLPLHISAVGSLHLHSIFPTIQGEGIFAGNRATFIRLAGCNLKCPGCDTDYTSNQHVMPDYILDKVEQYTSENGLIVITGGEPFRQNLDPLVTTLLYRGYTVQIETNGTLAPTVCKDVLMNRNFYIMCSPKTNRIHKELGPYISAYKYVVNACHVDPMDGLPTRVLDLKCNKQIARPVVDDAIIYVQPMDCKDAAVNYRNQKAAVDSCMQFGYILCLQIHKIAGVD